MWILCRKYHMPDVARVLKLEMKRIATKEVRASGLAPRVKALNRRVRELYGRLKAPEVRPAAVPAPVAAEGSGYRGRKEG